jgi:hypothetical protein
MIRRILGLAATLAVPSILAAQAPQIPNEHASATGKAMVAQHSQGAKHRATRHRGDVEADETARNPNAATPAVRATPAVPGQGTGETVPAKPATPAVPAHKGGASGSHRP